MDERLQQQLSFILEIDKAKNIFRQTSLSGHGRKENDAEHSWHIAVMALLFSEYFEGRPDIGRVALMCVVHDLVEIYAGDTFAFDKRGNLDKAEREKEAADKLFSQLPEEQGRMIRALWEEFDAMETDDARYAACMDRIQPLLHNTLTDGHTWVLGKATREDIEKREEVVRQNMPKVYEWIGQNIENGIKKGWIL